MKKTAHPLALILTLLTCTAILSTAVSAQSDLSFEQDGLTPSQIHQALGRAKAESLLKARRAVSTALADSPHGQTNYDVTFYDISIRVNDTTQILYGTVKFVAEATEDGVSVIDFDFYSGMGISSIVAPSGSLAYSRTGDFVSVTLDHPYNTGEEFEFDVTYSGHPPTGGLQAFSFDTHNGSPAISSLSEPYFARTWWPCKDRMDDKPDSVDSHIEVATELYCASNGILDSIRATSSNTRTFHYRVRYPMATYLFSVAISLYTVWEQTYTALDGVTTMPVIYHPYSDRYTYSLSTWNQTPGMIAVLAQNYGEYPFLKEKYGHANFEWSGAMEHQTNTSMTGTNFGFSWAVIVHELSHQWWGDMITCKSWHDIWLNEGWATYSEALYLQATSGWASYHTYMNSMAYKGSGTIYVYDTTDVYRIFNGNLSYDKGAWVVHMLRGVLGEDLFFQGVHAYYNSEFQYGAANTTDFENVFETATGRDLTDFFQDWIYGEGYPRYTYYYMDEPSDTGGYDVYMVVNQTQGTYPQVFHMPVDFYFAYQSEPGDTLTLTCDERRKRFKFNVDSPIDHIELDPSFWVLRDQVNYPWTFFIVTLPGELSPGVRMEDYLDTVQTRGGTDVIYAVSTGALPPGLAIDNNGVISGVPTQEGTFPFSIHATDLSNGRSDQLDYTIEIGPGTYCCHGMVGDADGQGGDEPTIGDISALIDLLFISGTPLTCYPEGDINQSGGYFPTREDISIGDISWLIDYLFISGTSLPNCF